MRGLPELREAVAAHYRRHQGLALDPDQVIVTSGATEAIAASLLALISPGDEVVLFQPLYDAYLPLVLRAGGVPRLVRLTPPDWRITEEALAEAFTPRTRFVLFNNPHNPTARAFDARRAGAARRGLRRRGRGRDLRRGLGACPVRRPDAFRRSRRCRAWPERTVKIGSAGKIFSLTGWKVGWAVAAPALAAAIARAHQFVTFSTPPNLQAAAAYGLGKDDAYFDSDARRLRRRPRPAARLARGGGLQGAAGRRHLFPQRRPASLRHRGGRHGVSAQRAVEECGVAAIPVSAFYAEDPVTNVVRLCFAKKPETIAAGVAGLARARALMAG